MRRSELAAAQGRPLHPSLACALGTGTIDFDCHSRSCAAQLIGNDMSLPCIVSILFWCSRWIAPSVCEIAPTIVTQGPVTDGAADFACPGAKGTNDDNDTVGTCHDGSGSGFDDASARSRPSESTDVSVDSVAAWQALGDLGRALCREPDVSDLHQVLLNSPRAASRVRDLFPLPLIACDVIAAKFGSIGEVETNVTDYLQGVIVGLNWLYGVRSTDLAIRRLTPAQLEEHSVIIGRTKDMHARLIGSIDSRANSGWVELRGGGNHFGSPPRREHCRSAGLRRVL